MLPVTRNSIAFSLTFIPSLAPAPIKQRLPYTMPDTDVDEWPPHLLALAGAWADMPLAAELRADLTADIPREPL